MTDPAHRFRMAMARNLGRIVTSGLAAELEAEVFGVPPTPLPPEPQGAQDHQDEREPVPAVHG